MIILDTNIVSQLMTKPDAVALAWLDRQPWTSLWTTAITVLEIRSGLAIMPGGRRQSDRKAARRERHDGERLGAERVQRIVDGVHHRTRCAGGAGFAGSLGAKLAVRRRRDHMSDFDIRHLGRHRNEIVGHVAIEELAALVIEAV